MTLTSAELSHGLSKLSGVSCPDHWRVLVVNWLFYYIPKRGWHTYIHRMMSLYMCCRIRCLALRHSAIILALPNYGYWRDQLDNVLFNTWLSRLASVLVVRISAWQSQYMFNCPHRRNCGHHPGSPGLSWKGQFQMELVYIGAITRNVPSLNYCTHQTCGCVSVCRRSLSMLLKWRDGVSHFSCMHGFLYSFSRNHCSVMQLARLPIIHLYWHNTLQVNSYIRALKPFTSNELAPYIMMIVNASVEIVASLLIIYGKHHAGTVGNLMIVFVLLNTIGMLLTSGLPEEQSEWILLSITFITAIGRLLTMSAAKETKKTKVN